MIVLADDVVARHGERGGIFALRFRCMDDGDVHSSIGAEDSTGTVPGTVCFSRGPNDIRVMEFGSPDDRVRVVVVSSGGPDDRVAVAGGAHGRWNTTGYVRRDGRWEADSVHVVEMSRELSARTRGLFETIVLANKCVFIPGLGSVGSTVALELIKAGVGHELLMDYDRVETGNVVRHLAGLHDVGRRKTLVIRDAIRDKNPGAIIETFDRRVGWDTKDLVDRLVRQSDLVICAADTREARLILNRACIKNCKPLLVLGAFRRAYGGQILVVHPESGPCYQCFLMNLSHDERERPARPVEWTEPVAYSDGPVPIEPGLSNDIAPISQMVVKLSLQHLLRGHPTTLRSLDEDLVAPWYLWLNRREAQTCYEQLEPLGFGTNGMCILRWYGIAMQRNPACPVCGNYVIAASQAEGVAIDQSDVDVYASNKGV
ncbi:MAG: ThiF family adenylyltransferase [Phycisphaerae bacterium]|nr:ThiF family adenylyltransferase [Phycisphaerae bacterium]